MKRLKKGRMDACMIGYLNIEGTNVMSQTSIQLYGWSQKKLGKYYNIDSWEHEDSVKHRINGIVCVPVYVCLMKSFVKIYGLV